MYHTPLIPGEVLGLMMSDVPEVLAEPASREAPCPKCRFHKIVNTRPSGR